MKKIVIIGLLLAVVLLTACSHNSKKNQKGTEPNSTNAAVEQSDTKQAVPNASVKEYYEQMKLGEAPIIDKDGSYIGAAEGIGFEYNGLTFELYLFDHENAELLQKAANGSVTYLLKGLESLGEQTAKAQVNKRYLLMYQTEDETVIKAFASVKA